MVAAVYVPVGSFALAIVKGFGSLATASAVTAPANLTVLLPSDRPDAVVTVIVAVPAVPVDQTAIASVFLSVKVVPLVGRVEVFAALEVI